MKKHSSRAKEMKRADQPWKGSITIGMDLGDRTSRYCVLDGTGEVVKEPAVESAVMPGMPPQVLCYERAEDIGFGVSGIVTRARALRASFPEIKTAGIPMAAPVSEEKVLYLLDPHGASRRSTTLQLGRLVQSTPSKFILPFEHHALNLPWTPSFFHQPAALILSMPVHAMGRRAGAKHRHRPNLARHARGRSAD